MSDTNYSVPVEAQREFERLMAYLQQFEANIGSNTRQEQEWIQPILKRIVQEFISVATEYFKLAQEVIGCASEKDKLNNDQPDEKKIYNNYHFGKVLRTISDHIGLLTEIDRYTRAEGVHGQTFIESIIWGASASFQERPVLIPIVANGFHYVHFNYVKSVGVIGFPAHILTNPPLDLPVLWHEVAGFWVAQERSSDPNRLEQRVKHLQQALRAANLAGGEDNPGTALDWYLAQFQKSVLEDWPTKLRIDRPGCRAENGEEIRRYFRLLQPNKEKKNVETDVDWQMDWLGEFMEDLFGIYALGSTYFRSLAVALLRRYRLLSRGSTTHPLPELRIKVALELLRGLNQSQVNVNSLSTRSADALTAPLQQVIDMDPRLKDLIIHSGKPNNYLEQVASIILKNVQFEDESDNTNDKGRRIDSTEVQVAEWAQEILKMEGAYKIDFGPYTDGLADIRKAYLAQIKSQPLQPSTYLWRAMCYNVTERRWEDGLPTPCDQLSPEQAQDRLNLLHRIKFSETDETPGEGAIYPLPPF